MNEYLLRWAFGVLGVGGMGVFLTRTIAHWVDQDTWVVRGVCWGMVLAGDIGVAMWLSVATALKILAVAVVVCGLMLWSDLACERRDDEYEAERVEKLFKKR